MELDRDSYCSGITINSGNLVIFADKTALLEQGRDSYCSGITINSGNFVIFGDRTALLELDRDRYCSGITITMVILSFSGIKLPGIRSGQLLRWY